MRKAFPVRRKFDGGIEPGRDGQSLVRGHAFDVAEIHTWKTEARRLLAPPGDGGGGIRKIRRAIDEEKRFAVNPDLKRIPEIFRESVEVSQVVLGRIDLAQEDLLIVAIPAAGPVFVGPAKAEGEVRLP